MGALLRFEFRKLFRNKAFYICLGIALFLLIINIITTKVLFDALGEELADMTEQMKTTMLSSFTGLSLLKTSFTNNTITIIGVVVAIITCEDFAADTIKNIYSKGYSRSQCYFAKLLSSFVAFLIITISGMIISFTFGSLLLDGVGTAGKNYILSIICIFLIALSFFMIFYAVSILFKKMAASIVLCVIGPTALLLLFVMADAFIGSDKFSISDYWIGGGLLTNLGLYDVEMKFITATLIIAPLTIAAFFLLSFFLNDKKDVK
jgi:ABC-type transport system involved in multi-copper enzyme maturation permease subunit